MAANKRRGTSEGHLVRRDEPAKYEKPKPTFSVDEKELPEIKSWSVGKKYKLSIEVEMVSHSKGDVYGIGDSSKQHEARLRVLGIKVGGADGDGY